MQFKFTHHDGEVFYDNCKSWEALINSCLRTDLSEIKSIEEVKTYDFEIIFKTQSGAIHKIVVPCETFKDALHEAEEYEPVMSFETGKIEIISITKQ